MSTLKLSRDPAVTVETFVAIGLGALLTLHLQADVLSYASAVVVAVGGLLTAAWVAKEKVLPALAGAIKAVFALVVGLGVTLDPNLEVGVVMVASALVTFFVRTQATAPVTADGAVVPVVDRPRIA